MSKLNKLSGLVRETEEMRHKLNDRREAIRDEVARIVKKAGKIMVPIPDGANKTARLRAIECASSADISAWDENSQERRDALVSGLEWNALQGAVIVHCCEPDVDEFDVTLDKVADPEGLYDFLVDNCG